MSSVDNPTQQNMPVRPALTQPIYLISDGGKLRSEGRLLPAIEAALEGARLPSGPSAGISAIGILQLREQVEGGGAASATDDETIAIGAKLTEICRKFQTKLIINRRIDIALEIGAAGVHLGADTIRLMPADPGNLIFGYSAHRAAEGLAAIEKGFNYVLFSPVFDPLSKRVSQPARGLEELSRLCSATTAPVYALGGITPNNARNCRVAGASGVAVITSILGQADPGRAAAQLFAAWNGR